MYLNIIKSRLFKALEQIQYGRLNILGPDGNTYAFAGPNPGPNVEVELDDWRVLVNLAAKGDVGMTEEYRDDRIRTNNLVGLIELGLINDKCLQPYLSGGFLSRCLAQLSYLRKANTIRGSRRNIHAHYDLGNDFYKLWLDPSMTYSSAVFSDGDDLLSAQNRKYDRILDSLGHHSGNLIELGCGWGGFAERAMASGDFDFKGVTLSTEQSRYAKDRLGSNADIAVEDYRIQEGKYQNLVSIEMFEAVGERFWPTYFKTVKRLLDKKGKAVIQTIVIGEQWFERYRRGSDMIRTFVFPGGMLPSAERFRDEAAKAGLKSEDSFFFGQDYAKTLEHWEKNFESKLFEVQALGFDEKFIRIWKFYLAACIAGFRQGRTDVMQVELSHE